MTFITCRHQKYLKTTLENENTFSYSFLYETGRHALPENKGDRGWKNRYCSLRQDTSFFKNIIVLQELRSKCKNEDMWHVELDLHNIRQEVADFEIAYCWMNPMRWHALDWRRPEYLVISPSLASQNDYIMWNFVKNRFKKISHMHLPICSVDDFINYGICSDFL